MGTDDEVAVAIASAQAALKAEREIVRVAARAADLAVARYNLLLAELQQAPWLPMGYRIDPDLGPVKDGPR